MKAEGLEDLKIGRLELAKVIFKSYNLLIVFIVHTFQVLSVPLCLRV